MAGTETYEVAFASSAGADLAGIPVSHLDLPGPFISHGLPYHVACARHVKQTYNASRVFIIASGSLSRSTDKLDLLLHELGEANIAGVQRGMKSHSLWSEILTITSQARAKNADCIVTLGAGSLTDAAKLVVFVRYPSTSKQDTTVFDLTTPVPRKQHLHPIPTLHLRPRRPKPPIPYLPPLNPSNLHPHHSLRRQVLRPRRRH